MTIGLFALDFYASLFTRAAPSSVISRDRNREGIIYFLNRNTIGCCCPLTYTHFCVFLVPPVPPKITTAPAREVQLSLSLSSVQNHILKCNASGYPHPNITWTKDGVPASQFSASGSLLYLDDVQREDAGSYICTASNGYGEDATSISIVNIRCKYSKHAVSVFKACMKVKSKKKKCKSYL